MWLGVVTKSSPWSDSRQVFCSKRSAGEPAELRRRKLNLICGLPLNAIEASEDFFPLDSEPENTERADAKVQVEDQSKCINSSTLQ